MLQNNFLTVLQFQLKLTIKSDSVHDYLVLNDEYFSQMEKCISLIYELNPDIVIFPEMSYSLRYHKLLKDFLEKINL